MGSVCIDILDVDALASSIKIQELDAALMSAGVRMWIQEVRWAQVRAGSGAVEQTLRMSWFRCVDRHGQRFNISASSESLEPKIAKALNDAASALSRVLRPCKLLEVVG